MQSIPRTLTFGLVLALLVTLARADAPATQPAQETHAVKKGRLKLEVTAEATLLPQDAQELRLKPKAYAGPFTVLSAAAPFAPVKQGQVVLEFDRKPYHWEMENATNGLVLAKASLAKAEADVQNGAAADATALRLAQDGLRNAEAAVSWFEKLDGPQMLKAAELSLTAQKHGLEDQSDELDQLKKMYKSEDLTNATADIVIKRALRRYEQSKVMVQMREEGHSKTLTHDYPLAKQRVLDGLEQARQHLANVKAGQEVSAIQRKNGLSAARIGLEQAQQRYDDLKGDEVFLQFKAAADGIVLYGSITEAGWAGGDPKSLKAGEKLQPGTVAVQVIRPGKLKLELPLSEAQALWVKAGSKASLTPSALPMLSYTAAASAPAPHPRGGTGFGFQITLHLPEADPRLLPGMKASVRIEEPAEECTLVPLAFVREGKVQLKGGEARAVKFGRSDGKHVEVLDGLKEGDVLVKAAK